MGLTGNELYNAEMQERVFREYLLPKKRPKLAAFLFHGVGTVDDAQWELALEWASIAAPAGRRTKTGKISDGTSTYYDEGEANKANMASTNTIRSILTRIKQS